MPRKKAPPKTSALLQRKPKAARKEIRNVKRKHGEGVAKSYTAMYNRRNRKRR